MLRYEIFFKYDDSWSDTEILHLTQIIQRILGLEESLYIARMESREIAIPIPQVTTDPGAQVLLYKICETVLMGESYIIGWRKCGDSV